MSKGFIYNASLCAGCGACSAACYLGNSFSVRVRNIYSNGESALNEPVINLSLACNHCDKPVCLEGCPSTAYHRDPASGAIIIDDSRCLGCRYCQWNCPYDAPKYDSGRKVIGKCHLCYDSIGTGDKPACAIACPTGALDYGELPGEDIRKSFLLTPGKELRPSIHFAGNNGYVPLKIYSAGSFNISDSSTEKTSVPETEWSLVLFSFLATIAVAVTGSSLLNGSYPDPLLTISLLLFAGMASLFHPGKKLRSWRAVANLKRSPLSREIFFFLLFAGLASTAAIMRNDTIIIAASACGMILLLLIDNVYIYSCRKKNVIFHPGQTLPGGLLMISFLAGDTLPFIFIAALRIILSAYTAAGRSTGLPGIRFFRYALLVIISAGMASGYAVPDAIMSTLFFAGEFAGRFLFYADFRPVNIRDHFNNH